MTHHYASFSGVRTYVRCVVVTVRPGDWTLLGYLDSSIAAYVHTRTYIHGHTHAHTLTLILSLSHTHTRTHSHIHTFTLTLAHTHKHTHIHVIRPSHPRPGEWYLEKETRRVWIWMPDNGAPHNRVAFRAKDYCVDLTSNGSPIMIENVRMHSCTFRLRNCSGCGITNVSIRYPSYARTIALRNVEPGKFSSKSVF